MSAEYQIECGIDIPVIGRRNPANEFLPQMTPGDSVLVTDRREWNRIRMAVTRHSRETGKRFVTRTGFEGLRVWRVA